MTDETTLGDFAPSADVSPPRVSRRCVIQSPTNGKIAGFIAKEHERGFRAYTALKRGQHYYAKGMGYPISDLILKELNGANVDRILIHEGTEEDDDVLEFAFRQYAEHGESVPHEDLMHPDDTQKYVHQDDALFRWDDHAADLFAREFGDALEAIDFRGYDPDFEGML